MKQVNAFNKVDEKLNDHACKDNINCGCTLHAKSYYGRGIYITVLFTCPLHKKITMAEEIYITCAFSLYINEFTINRY